MSDLVKSILISLIFTPLVTAATFEPLGTFANSGSLTSEANTVSSDGSVIAGSAFLDGPATDAFRWKDGVFTELGKTDGQFDTISEIGRASCRERV